jgi:hypothetical protein
MNSLDHKTKQIKQKFFLWLISIAWYLEARTNNKFNGGIFSMNIPGKIGYQASST